MNRKGIALAIMALFVCVALSGCSLLPENLFVSNATGGTTATGDTVTISRAEYERLQSLSEVADVVDYAESLFYQPIDEETKTLMLEYAAAGALSALGDPYTFYYTPEAYTIMWEDDSGEYAGVGLQITTSYVTGICTISRVFEDTPAEEAGILKGDVLIKVNELDVDASTINEAISIMRGEIGTTVEITMLRNGEELVFTVPRAKINVNWVSSTMLEDGIGYIELFEFSTGCASDLEKRLNDLMANGAKGIILDLRDNPGGWVDEANKIASLFVDKGVLCYLEDKNGARQYYYTTAGVHDVQLVILLNENSASSAEVLTGCLMDRTDCTTVGVTSYGKGIVQNVIGLGDSGAGMQITIAQYYTPNGTAVHHVGITPDVVVPLPEGDVGNYDFADVVNDLQLAKALEVMREKLAE